MNQTAAPNLLQGARVYLSGPMDFVASRADEKAHGWRNRISQFLQEFGVTVFDPWFKPEVRGLHEYGAEGEVTAREPDPWSFEPTRDGARARAHSAENFWPALHIDLRMVDTSDFIISYCPTNIYSVGTPHEIILCRNERKPVLFVSPPIEFPSLDRLREHLRSKGDQEGVALLQQLEGEVPIKPNPAGNPSQWYRPLIGGEHFFDGFGFDAYRSQFDWPVIGMDQREELRPPHKPLLPFLEKLSRELPKKWDRIKKDYVPNDDWLLWDLKPTPATGGAISSTFFYQGYEEKDAE